MFGDMSELVVCVRCGSFLFPECKAVNCPLIDVTAAKRPASLTDAAAVGGSGKAATSNGDSTP